MARSLKGKKFFIYNNNGVNAIAEQSILCNHRKRQQIEAAVGVNVSDGLMHLPLTPIFTFGNVSHSPFVTCTAHSGWWDELLWYIGQMGGSIGIGRPFYVPFSNQYHLGQSGRKTQLAELQYVTSEVQFEETFGISLNELISRAWKKEPVTL